MLLCDFHIHTRFSDGSMSLPRTVDLFGQAGFDVIAITDHITHGSAVINGIAHVARQTLTRKSFPGYLRAVREEAERAMERYGMLVIPGVEISKNYISSSKSAHILLLDVSEFVPAKLDYPEIFEEARRQDALTVACHPHYSSDPTRDTLYLWENRRRFARQIDAWEVGNRDDLFNVVSLKKYPYLANSDFHRPRHLYSWKTLLPCEKETAAVKECIRSNRGVALTLFRK